MRTSRRRTSRGPQRRRRVSRNVAYTLPTHRTDKSKWFVMSTAVPGAKGAFDGGAFFDTRKNAESYIADAESDYWKKGKYTYELKTVAQLDKERRGDVLARAKAGWRVEGFERSFVGHEGELKRARALAARRRSVSRNARDTGGDQHWTRAREHAATSVTWAMGTCRLDDDEFLLAADSYLRAFFEYARSADFDQATTNALAAEFLGFLKRSVECAQDSDEWR